MRIPNAYYPSEEEYLFAIADVMREEYQAIVRSGLLLQIDSPDAAMSWDRQNWDSLADFRKALAGRIQALNYALKEIPQEKVRFHVCWGNQELPHTNDIPLADIIDLVLTVDAGTYCIESANPRHGHEWRVWEEVGLPDDKKLMPGVIDTTTNFVEHPELVADRIERYARIAGPDRVIAGTDCGFSTRAGASPRVHPDIAIAKIRSLAEGARIAGGRLGSV